MYAEIITCRYLHSTNVPNIMANNVITVDFNKTINSNITLHYISNSRVILSEAFDELQSKLTWCDDSWIERLPGVIETRSVTDRRFHQSIPWSSTHTIQRDNCSNDPKPHTWLLLSVAYVIIWIVSLPLAVFWARAITQSLDWILDQNR